MEEEVQLNTELPAQDGIEPSDSQDNPAENRQPEPDEKRETRRKFVRVLTNKYFIVTLVYAVIVLFVDRNNLIRWAGDYLEVLRQERVIRQYGGRGSVYCRLNLVMVRSMPASPKDLTASTALSLISGSCLISSSSHFPRTKST